MTIEYFCPRCDKVSPSEKGIVITPVLVSFNHPHVKDTEGYHCIRCGHMISFREKNVKGLVA